MLAVAERLLVGQGDLDYDLPREAAQALLAEANAIAEEDVAFCRQIGAHGAELVPESASILTHCNTGSLATVEYGTALGVIRAAHEAGKVHNVYVDETRPFLQGARLTAWELQQEGIPQTLISDNMAGHFMMRGAVDLVIVGADRIAANGDVANKIGTYTLAVLCKENGLPFYVAAPTSTIDLSLESGDQIPIEERASDEVTHVGGKRLAPEGVRAAHPAFDVTPNRYVTAIITEQGVHRAPYEPALRDAVAAAEAARRRAQRSRVFERNDLADVGVIGGSGFYELLKDVEEHAVQTPYGPPSGTIAVGTYEGVRVAFLARHGPGHRYPPHKINYRANIWALATLGVTPHPRTERLRQRSSRTSSPATSWSATSSWIGPPAASRRSTTARRSSTSAAPSRTARSCASSPSRPAASWGSRSTRRGTVVVIQGPRFSTRAESRWFSREGWEVVNMTQFPEQVLARELEVCYVGISLITDYDVGLEGQEGVEPVSVAGVIEVFHRNNARVRDLLLRMIPRIPRDRACICATALTGAVIG